MLHIGLYGVDSKASLLEEPQPAARPVLTHVRVIVPAVKLVHQAVDEIVLGYAAVVDHEAASRH